MILFWYGLGVALFWVVTSLYLQINRARIAYLADIAATPLSPEPSVALIIAVRNEEQTVEQALQTVCRLQYGAYRILVVNDRSTDRTPEILDRFARQYPAITVLSIDTLPAGWLGKNHALYQGYLHTTAEWLLFTDADVEFSPQALRKAMAYARSQQLDHLTILPETRSRSGWLRGMLATFKIMLELKLRPWDLRNPRSTASMGVGAFNLVRRQAYQQAGTHQPIALRPDDDLKLGELLKKAGFRQDVLYGDGEIGLEWYPSVGGFVKGLMKNTFATANYNLFIAIGMALATLLAFALPLPLLLTLGGWPEKILALLIFASQVPLFIAAKSPGSKAGYVLLVPLAGALLSYIILKSALLTLWQGGIYWRDSFYPLSELKKNR